MADELSYRDAWRRGKGLYRSKILTDSVAHALWHLGERALAEQDAEIAQLRAELDGYLGRTVIHCTEAVMDTACLASLDEPDGTILRATDTGRELVLTDRTWMPR